MNRATIALVGATILVMVGAITEEHALQSIDLGTILLLGAMMVININLRLAGFFRVIVAYTLKIAHSPRMLLALVIVSSGVLSALFLNDTICLMLTPLVIDTSRRLSRNPIPYLIGLATATNIGSVATLTGNPQNLIIGQASDIPYLVFLQTLAPIAIIGLFICWLVIVLTFRDEFRGQLPPLDLATPSPYVPLFSRTLLLIIGLLMAFLSGVSIVLSACVVVALLLVSRIHPRKLLDLDWELLAFFAGLFVITGAVEATGLSRAFLDLTQPLINNSVVGLSLVTAVLSNLVSNVPAVLLMQSTVSTFEDTQRAWLVLAMASTLAGNFTLLGSAATLIVAELARERGVALQFVAYLWLGIPITVGTLLVGILWLTWMV